MSKAENGFLVIKDRYNQKLGIALRAACDFMTENCERCPLMSLELCAEECLPEGIMGDKHRVCSDWVKLHLEEKP